MAVVFKKKSSYCAAVLPGLVYGWYERNLQMTGRDVTLVVGSNAEPTPGKYLYKIRIFIDL